MDPTGVGAADLDRAAAEVGRLEALADALDARLVDPRQQGGPR